MTHPTSLITTPTGDFTCEPSTGFGAVSLATMLATKANYSPPLATKSPNSSDGRSPSTVTDAATVAAPTNDSPAPNPSLPGGWRERCVVAEGSMGWYVKAPGALGESYWLCEDGQWRGMINITASVQDRYFIDEEGARAALAIAEPWPGYVEPKPASNGTESKPELPDVAGGVPLPEYMRRKPSPEFLAKASALRTPARETLTFGKPGDPQHRPFWELAASIVHGRFPSEFCITHPNAQQREIIAALVAARNLGQADYRHHLADIQATGLSVLIREGEPNRLCAPKGHVLTDDGEVIGVLGELPLTADRKLIGFGAEAITAFCPHSKP